MVDKNTIQQVLGSLIQKPSLLSEIDKYNLELSDFSSRFEKIIFLAIKSLYEGGASVITPIDIENCLDADESAKLLFSKSNGIEYLQDIVELSSWENFEYYYTKLKKFNLLRDLKKQGIDIKDFYNENLTEPGALEINAAFEALTIKDICETIKRKLIKIENKYEVSEEVSTELISSDIDELLKELKKKGQGVPIQGKIYSQIIDGAQPGALTIRSASSGLGKTRQAVGDACFLSFPIRYNSQTCCWENIGNNDKVLFIITEQTFLQIRAMTLAYLTDIDESRFKYEVFSERERKVIEQAAYLMKEFENNFVIVKVPNPTIQLIKSIIREKCLTNDIKHVFYDYIFIGPALLGEFRGFNLRNDEILLMFATALKDLAVELQVSMFTSTQVNAASDDNRNIRNESSLAGGRSTINKADNGAIMARPTNEELQTLAPLIAEYGKPNVVTDIFKVRSGEWSQVRIWSTVNLGRMKKKDLFITDSSLEPISNFVFRDMVLTDWTKEETEIIFEIVKNLNRG